MAEVGSGLWRSSRPTHLNQLELVVQDCAQTGVECLVVQNHAKTGVECLHRWRLHSMSGQHDPVFEHPQVKNNVFVFRLKFVGFWFCFPILCTICELLQPFLR